MQRASPDERIDLRAFGGIARQQTLIAGGVAKADIADAVAGGRLRRIRRSWLATADADPMLVAAARSGVMISCVTLARRRGVWVLADDRPHVCAPPHSGGVRFAASVDDPSVAPVVHWNHPTIARLPQALEDTIENALVLVSLCQPDERAQAIWDSALRLKLIDREIVRRMSLPRAARRHLEAANPHLDSGLESFVLLRLRWLGLRVIPQAWLYGHRVDFLIGDRLVLQIDGGHHVGRQREEDIRHDAELMLRGYHVIRVGYAQVVDDWPSVQWRIMQAVAQGLHRGEARHGRSSA